MLLFRGAIFGLLAVTILLLVPVLGVRHELTMLVLNWQELILYLSGLAAGAVAGAILIRSKPVPKLSLSSNSNQVPDEFVEAELAELLNKDNDRKRAWKALLSSSENRQRRNTLAVFLYLVLYVNCAVLCQHLGLGIVDAGAFGNAAIRNTGLCLVLIGLVVIIRDLFRGSKITADEISDTKNIQPEHTAIREDTLVLLDENSPSQESSNNEAQTSEGGAASIKLEDLSESKSITANANDASAQSDTDGSMSDEANIQSGAEERIVEYAMEVTASKLQKSPIEAPLETAENSTENANDSKEKLDSTQIDDGKPDDDDSLHADANSTNIMKVETSVQKIGSDNSEPAGEHHSIEKPFALPSKQLMQTTDVMPHVPPSRLGFMFEHRTCTGWLIALSGLPLIFLAWFPVIAIPGIFVVMGWMFGKSNNPSDSEVQIS